MNVEEIAQVAHELNKAYCEANGDTSQQEWKDAPQWQKDSAINGVHFHLKNPAASPSASHDAWMKQKADDGWKHGPVKDPEKKEHPSFLPYDQLPATEKAKDYIFRQTIHSLKKFLPNRVLTGELSFGEKAVGIKFNPSGFPEVEQAKQTFADAIDQMNDLRRNSASGEVRRHASVAITEAEGAQMRAVKALTWQD